MKSIIIDRVQVLLEPDLTDEREVEGILNPAVAGNYLLYRAVGHGNYSRIMAAELSSEPAENNSTRLTATKLKQVVLEPEEDYELVDDNHGGIEDPRVTELSNGSYVMFYTGYGRPKGFTRQVPLVALATSTNGLVWQRHGRVIFAPYPNDDRIDFNTIPNKDTVLFSEKINGRYALLHRPMFTHKQAKEYNLPWRAIWYAESESLNGPWGHHQMILAPQYQWEHGGVGAGVPPIHLKDVWLHIYHGFTLPNKHQSHRRYSAGVFATPHNDPTLVIFRSQETLLEPTILEEQVGSVPHVVFPTAVWQEDTRLNTLAIFWGAADTRIVWGLLRLPGDIAKPESDIAVKHE